MQPGCKPRGWCSPTLDATFGKKYPCSPAANRSWCSPLQGWCSRAGLPSISTTRQPIGSDAPAATAPRRQCARTRLASFFSSFLSCARDHYGQCNPRSMAAWWWLANRASASLTRARPQGAPGAEGPIPVRCGAQQVPALPAERSRRGHTSAASSRELRHPIPSPVRCTYSPRRRRHCPHTHYICHERESERERRKNRENCG